MEGNLFVEKINALVLERNLRSQSQLTKTEKEKVNDFGINTLVNVYDREVMEERLSDYIKLVEFILNQTDNELKTSGIYSLIENSIYDLTNLKHLDFYDLIDDYVTDVKGLEREGFDTEFIYSIVRRVIP